MQPETPISNFGFLILAVAFAGALAFAVYGLMLGGEEPWLPYATAFLAALGLALLLGGRLNAAPNESEMSTLALSQKVAAGSPHRRSMSFGSIAIVIFIVIGLIGTVIVNFSIAGR